MALRDVAVITIAIFCSLVALRRPVFGLLAFIFFGLFNPHSMAWTITQTFNPAQPIALGTLIGFLISSEPKRFPWNEREFILLLALWCMFGISTLFAIYPERAYEKFILVSKILLMVFLSMSLINTEYRFRWLLRIIGLTPWILGTDTRIVLYHNRRTIHNLGPGIQLSRGQQRAWTGP